MLQASCCAVCLCVCCACKTYYYARKITIYSSVIIQEACTHHFNISFTLFIENKQTNKEKMSVVSLVSQPKKVAVESLLASDWLLSLQCR